MKQQVNKNGIWLGKMELPDLVQLVNKKVASASPFTCNPGSLNKLGLLLDERCYFWFIGSTYSSVDFI